MPREMSRADRLQRIILVGLSLSLPTLSLVPLGGLFLWQRGWLLYWAVGALLVVSIITLVERRMVNGAARSPPQEQQSKSEQPYPAGTLAARAWSDVQDFANSIEPAEVNTMRCVTDMGLAIITLVAKRMHPERSDPVWNFTIPEALFITEQVSHRLSDFAVANIPLSDRLTVAQLRLAYRWRGAIGAAEHAYNLWRLLRLANPATAASNEARDRLSRAALNWGREQLIGKLVRAYVEEVGRTAIDLYSGRCVDASKDPANT